MPSRREKINKAHASALSRGAKCHECVHALKRMGPVESIAFPSDLVVIGAGPGRKEVDQKEPYVGPTGRSLQEALTEGGYARSEVAMLNVVECMAENKGGPLAVETEVRRMNEPALKKYSAELKQHKAELKVYRGLAKAWAKEEKGRKQADYPELPPAPPKKPKLQKSPVECCRPRFIHDFKQVSAKVIVPMDKLALKESAAIFKIPVGGKKKKRGELRSADLKKQRGHPIPLDAKQGRGKPRFILPTYQPNPYNPKTRHLQHVIRDDLVRACDIAKTGKLRWTIGEIIMPTSVNQIVRWAKKQLARKRRQMVDIETGPRLGKGRSDGLHVDALIRCVGFTSGREGKETTMVVPFYHKSGKPWWTFQEKAHIEKWLRRVLDTCNLDFQNGYAFDRPRLMRAGLLTVGYKPGDRDLVIVAHNTREQSNDKDLGFLISRHFDMPLHKNDVDHKVAGNEMADRDLHYYCGQDCIAQARVIRRHMKWVEQDQTEAQLNYDYRMAPVVTDMCLTPIPIKESVRVEKLDYLVSEVKRLKTRVQDVVGSRSFNPNSGDHIRDWIYKKKNNEPQINTEGYDFKPGDKPATSIPAFLALEDTGLCDADTQEFINAIIEYKTIEQLRRMVNGVKHEFNADWGAEFRRLWVTWKLHTVPSGRLASSPNVQNWPSIGVLNMKELIWAPPGHVIVGADGEQIEARVCALASEDEFMLDLFHNGKDVHAYNAALLLSPDSSEAGIIAFAEQIIRDRKQTCSLCPSAEEPCKKCSKIRKGAEDKRKVAKIFCYLCQYGGEEEKLGSSMRNYRDKATGKRMFEYSPAELEKLCALWFKKFHAQRPWTRRWHAREARKVDRLGWNSTLFSDRRRFYPGGPGTKNMPPNHQVQGGAADLMNDALLGIAHDIPRGVWSPWSGVFIQIHDYIGVIVPEERAEEAKRIIERHMNTIKTFRGNAMEFKATATISQCLKDQ